MKSIWIRVNPKPSDECPYGAETDSEERPREVGSRDWRDAATSQGTLGTQKPEEAGKILPWSLQGEYSPVDTLIWGPGLQNWESPFLVVQPLGLRSVVTVAPGHYHRRQSPI